MKALLILAAFIVAVSAIDIHFKDIVRHEWELFKAEHQKIYKHAEEEQHRLKIYMENRLKIAQHNLRYHKGEVKYTMGVNKYADMTPAEFKNTMNGFKRLGNQTYKMDPKSEGVKFQLPVGFSAALPQTVDWRKKGAVTPVKDQGHCGSCWSFSATGALEGQHFRKKGVLVSLSEQNLVDCSSRYDNHGCNGGLMDNAFKYIKDNGGIDTEKSYPYEGIDDTCRYDPSNKGADDKGFVDIPEGDEQKLMEALAHIGPVSVAIDASHQSFQLYTGGVYDEEECSPQELDHGVLAVGYGTDERGNDYWLVKNSWGTSWGDTGYIKMSRNKENQCGIASAASYPLV